MNSGQYENALAIFKRQLIRFKDGKDQFSGLLWGGHPHRCLAAIYIMVGHEEEARKHATELLKVNPDFTLKGLEQYLNRNYKRQSDIDIWINALRKAGLEVKTSD